MKAMIYEAFAETPRIDLVKDPVPSPGGVVVKVLAGGVCLSDWHGWMGHDTDIKLPHVPGHELVGEIVEIGSSIKHFQVGDRVTVPFVSGCGNCEWCRSGNHQICDHQFQPGFTAWGCFAEYVALEYAEINLINLPEQISSVDAASLGCRFITSFRAVVDQAHVKKGEWVAVHGCGGIGLSVIMIADAMGANVVGVDINDNALGLAKKMGAVYVINSNSTDVVNTIRDITDGGADVSFDALGSNETCFNSISSLKKLGRHIQIGLMAGDDLHPEVPMHLVVANELKIIGSHGMQAFGYPAIFDMMNDGLINPSILVQRRITLDDAVERLMDMNQFKHEGITVIDKF